MNKTKENLCPHEVYILFIINFKLLYTPMHVLLHWVSYIMGNNRYLLGNLKYIQY